MFKPNCEELENRDCPSTVVYSPGVSDAQRVIDMKASLLAENNSLLAMQQTINNINTQNAVYNNSPVVQAGLEPAMPMMPSISASVLAASSAIVADVTPAPEMFPANGPVSPPVPEGTAVLPPIAPFVPPSNVVFPTIPTNPLSDSQVVSVPMTTTQLQTGAFFASQTQTIGGGTQTTADTTISSPPSVTTYDAFALPDPLKLSDPLSV